MVGFVLALIAILRAFPDAAFSRWLHHHTVARIAGWTRRHVMFAAIFLLLMMLGQGWLALSGYDMVVAFAWDASLWVDGAFVWAVLKECVPRFRKKR